MAVPARRSAQEDDFDMDVDEELRTEEDGDTPKGDLFGLVSPELPVYAELFGLESNPVFRLFLRTFPPFSMDIFFIFSV